MSQLLAHRPFRTLLAAQVVSELGTWLAYVALAVVVYDETHSPAWVSVLLLLDTIPAIWAGAFLAPIVDRWSRRRVLVGAELAGAATFTALALVHGLVALLVLAFVAGCASSLTRPALNAALPNLVPEDGLAAASGLMQTVGSVGVLGGPALAGVLVTVGGGSAAFALNAVSFAVSAALLARIPAGSLQDRGEREAARAEGGHRRALVSGLRAFGTPRLRAVLVGWSIASLAWGPANVAEVLVAKRLFGVGDAGFGLLAAASGGGMLVGSVLFARVAGRVAPFRAYVAALVLAAAGLAGMAVAPWFWLAVACWTVGTCGNALALAAQRLVVQREAEGVVRGRVFGLLGSCGLAVSLVGLTCAGAAVEVVGVRGLIGLSAAAALAAGVTAAAVARRRAPRRTAPARGLAIDAR